jgi:hypothetical protein
MSENPYDPDLMAEGLDVFAAGDHERGLALMRESNRRVRAWLDARHGLAPPSHESEHEDANGTA